MRSRASVHRASRQDPAAVLTMLREQVTLYQQLETLSRQQRTLVTKEDVTPLLSLLADRQGVADRLARIGQQLAPIRRDWVSVREQLPQRDRDQAERLIAEATDRLSRVIQSDEEDARVLSGRRLCVAGTLRESHAVSRAISAYRAPATASGRLDCVEGEA